LSREGFLTKNIAALTSALESVILNEELAHTRGLIQSLDPRVKLFAFILLMVIAGLSQSLWILVVILALALGISGLAKIPPGFFVKRVLLFLPLTAIIALPALFITPGDALWQIGSRVIITFQGAHTAAFLLLRVMASLSFGLLLILTTPWNSILLALRWFRLPAVLCDILGMTYRYIFLFLNTASSLFLARRSRTLGTFTGSENRRWLARSLASTLAKSQHLSEEVYLAMLSRGYQGEIYTLARLQLKGRDYLWTGCLLLLAFVLLWSNYRWWI
jgi:cobalt/nickel transport system permease protein